MSSKGFYCASLFGKQRLIGRGSVFNFPVSGKNSVQGKSRFYRDDEIEASVLFGIMDGKIIKSNPEDRIKLKILSTRIEKGVAFKKNKRKRYQRKVGFRKTILTLKHII